MLRPSRRPSSPWSRALAPQRRALTNAAKAAAPPGVKNAERTALALGDGHGRADLMQGGSRSVLTT